MPTRNQHAHAHGSCNTHCGRPAATSHNAQARAPLPRVNAQAGAAAATPRGAQTQRTTPFGAHAPAHAAASARTAPHALPTAQGPRALPNAGARSLPTSPAQGATAQRRAAVQTPVRGAGFAVQPPSPLGGGAQQIKVTVAGSRQVAGSVEIRPTGGGKAFISDLLVERDYRRKGLANQLMNAALRSARGQGFRTAQLEARPSDDGISSQALVSMYRRMGFRSVGKSSRGNPLMERRL